MASIDALTGVLTARQSLNAAGNNDSNPESTGTASTTPADEGQSHDRAVFTREGQEQEGVDYGIAEIQIQAEERRRATRASLISKSVSQDSEGEDEVLDFIEVGKPALPRSFTENEHTLSAFRVEVPEVQRRWEYRVFEEEYTIRSVLRELRVQNKVKYEVRFEDGHIALVRQSSAI